MPDHPDRLISLDVGDVRIGVAIADESGLIARPLAIIKRDSGKPADKIADLARTHMTTHVVIGLPKNMDGTEGPQAKKSRNFAARLTQAAPELRVIFWDERLSTETARELAAATRSRRDRRKHIDDIAAAVILQEYLDESKKAEGKSDETQQEER